MGTRSVIWIGMFIGSTIGGFIPSLWGADVFSMSGIFWSSAGAIVGIYLAFKFTE